MNQNETGGFQKTVKQKGKFDDGTGKRQFNSKKSKKANYPKSREYQ